MGQKCHFEARVGLTVWDLGMTLTNRDTFSLPLASSHLKTHLRLGKFLKPSDRSCLHTRLPTRKFYKPRHLFIPLQHSKTSG